MIKFFAVIFVLMLSFANPAQAQALPAKIKNYLDKNYRGWKISPTPNHCGDAKSILSGDFNGDRKRDYAAKIFKGKNGYILAFVEQKNDYAPYLLYRRNAAETRNTALILYRKGEKYYPEPGEESSAIVLKNDALYDSPCESDASVVHVFRKGKFVPL